jgi:pyruvate/2-oxoglutarate dehydrogenase complex dihydrolipoamide acyltransferase (E2) component
LAEIAQAISALARKARDGTLTIEDLSGGTFTITNGAQCWCRCRPTARPGAELRVGVHDLLDDREQVEGAARV